MEFLHQIMLLVCQPIRISRIDCREIGIEQSIFLPFILENSPLKIYQMQQLAPLHTEIRTTVNDGSFQLQLYDGNGFMHLGNETQRLFIVAGIGEVQFRCKNLTGIISINIHGKGRQRKQVDAVSVFQCSQIGITHGHTNHVCHTGIISRRRPHPKEIMITPLDIEVVIIAKRIHNNMCPRTTVINITNNMQGINGKTLDQITHSYDKVIGTLGRNDGTDDDINIRMLIRIYSRFMQQLLNDIGKIFRQSFPHFGTGIFG